MPDLSVHEYTPVPGLGRHQVLDPRSLAYRRRYDGQPIRPTAWEPRLPVLDQSNLLTQGIHTKALFSESDVDYLDALASCTGNAATTLLSTILTKDACAAAGLDTDNAAAAETWAIGLYADATTYDQWHQYTWPTQDCGSSGLGVAKALRGRGLIDQYGHATTAEELCTLLQTGPVLMGLPWYAAWDTPPATGLLDDIPDWDRSPVAGGHEVVITALEAVARIDGDLSYDHTVLRAQNSWSASWGDHGSFRLSLDLYERLRADIDLIQPRLDGSRA
ncbi:hypothetical protein [Streptomyces sp. NPDC017529]|uniref:hypothetical protein n=1 Tax=Streptomyces sp. NPDC017529 TaxID=3365000 RepID=UPI0037A6B692